MWVLMMKQLFLLEGSLGGRGRLFEKWSDLILYILF